MKKILCMVLILGMLLTAAVGCGMSEVTTETTTATNDVNITPELPEGEQLITRSYTAVLNDETWSGIDADTSAYTLFGTGAVIYSQAKTDYKQYTLTFVIVENGIENSYTGTAVFSVMKSLGVCGATVTLDEAAKTATVKVCPIETKVLTSWKAVNAKADAYVRFEFTTSADMEYAITVTPEKGGKVSTSAYTQDGITVSGADGKFVGTAKCTVPYFEGKTYYINICLADSYLPVASIPLNILPAEHDTGFHLIFQGDWDLVTDETYFAEFTDMFQHTYPKIYARWAILGNEPKTVIFKADKNYTGVAYQSGGTVVISVNYLNGGPDKLTIIAHETTHSVEMYGGKLVYDYVYDSDGKTIGGWWTENLANYGALRYCHLSYSNKFIQTFDVQNNSKLWDWGYAKYSDGGKIFIAWLDWNYPTTDKNGDGTISVDEYGAVDLINYTIKHTTEKIVDNPYDENSEFNKALYKATGKYKTVEEARLQYAEDCKSGAFVLNGFRDYQDNFLTENLPGVSENNYIMNETAVPTAKTNPVLAAAMTTGDNLCKGAFIARVGSVSVGVNAPENMIDGDLESRYQAARSSDLYAMSGICNEIVIDLGGTRTFDTYTLVGYGNTASYIMKSWEFLISDNGVNFTAIDYQKDNTEATVSVSFDEVSARYVMIRLYEPDAKAGITRISELMLFDSEQ